MQPKEIPAGMLALSERAAAELYRDEAEQSTRALLEQRGCFIPTSDGNVARGTLAAKLGGARVEVTTFRAGDAAAPMRDRIRADLSERDMTIGALAVALAVEDAAKGAGADGSQNFRWQQRLAGKHGPALGVQRGKRRRVAHDGS